MSTLLGKGAHSAPLLKRAIIAPQIGHWEAIFLFFYLFYLGEIDYLSRLDQIEKGRPTMD